MNLKIILAAASAAATSFLCFTQAPAHALSLTFDPTGTRLDSDVRRDIDTTVGSALKFQVLLETFGLAPDERIEEIEYNFRFDQNELGFLSFDPNLNLFNSFTSTLFGNQLNISQGSGSLANRQAGLVVGEVYFTVLSGLVNDGAPDLSLSFTKALGDDGLALANLSGSQLQTVEVQPVPTPALLPGLIGLGVAALRRKNEESAEENA